MSTATRRPRPLPRRTVEALAACEQLGLSYWSDAPSSGCVWAVDAGQRAHLVLINRKAGTAQYVRAEARVTFADHCGCMPLTPSIQLQDKDIS